MSARDLRHARPALPWFAASLLCWGALLAMVLSGTGLAADDRPLLHWLVRHRGPGWSRAMEAVSSSLATTLIAATTVTVGVAVGLLARSWRPPATVVLAAGGAAVSGVVLKDLVRRSRPPLATMLGVPENGWGFPSNHTLVTTAVAGALVLIAWRATPRPVARAVALGAGALAALLMGASRLYMGDHWLTDVLAAYAVAGGVLAVVAWITTATNWLRVERTARAVLHRSP